MESISSKLNKWAIDRIKNEYNGKISLLLGRKTVGKIPSDDEDIIFDYFIPACNEGYDYAKTFIIEDRGFDLFPMSWERVEGLASLSEGILFCLADSEILYSKSEEDKNRYENLRKKFFENLKNPKVTYIKSLQRINSAKEIYTNMLFESDICNIRKAVGGILQYLCEAIAIRSGTYIKGDYGYSKRIEQIKMMKNIPHNFIELYEKLLSSSDKKEINELTYNIISETRELYSSYFFKNSDNKYNYEDLAGWYEEGKYTFRRIEYACDNKDYESAYNWGCYMQIEFDILSEEASLKKMDLLGSYNSKDLLPLKNKIKEIEKYILSQMIKHNVKLKKYDNIEDFLKSSK